MAALALLLVVLVVSAARSWWGQDTAFDAARWKAAKATACSEQGEGARARMVDDLRQNYLRPGTERRHVLALLGPPDDSYGSRLLWATQSGFTRCWYLEVRFENGRVAATGHDY